MSGIEIKKIKTATTKQPVQEEGFLDRLTGLLNKDISLSKKTWKNAQRERFYSELHTLLTSGLDIRLSLELILSEQEKPFDKQLVEKIKDLIISGESFHMALKISGHFSPYEYYSIKIGEETGNLPIILQDLVKYYAARIKQQRQIVSLLSYPALVTTTAILAVVFMLNFIVPLFADVFKRFGGDLPWLTKAILHLSDVFKQYLYLMVAVVATVVVFVYTQSSKDWFRARSTKLLIAIPVIGNIVLKVYLARFCQVMALLMGAKVPMLNAIDLVGKMIGFYPLEQSLKQTEQDIMNGISLHKSLARFPIYPKRMVSLVNVAEEANQLENIFTKLAEQMSAEAEHQTAVLSSLLEPLLIIFLAAIVGVVLISMYLPMFQLSTNIK